MRNINLANSHAAWEIPVYYEPVRVAPVHRHYALSISAAIAVVVTALTGAAVYHRLDTLSDLDTYVAMGPSQSHIEADNAVSERTLLVTLTPPVYTSIPVANYAYADNQGTAVRLSAETKASDAQAIADRLINEANARSADAAANDDIMASQADTPIAADSLTNDADPVAALLSDDASNDSSM